LSYGAREAVENKTAGNILIIDPIGHEINDDIVGD
jgi:hypothetical protein